ncbi:transposase [Nocardioides iriomotensis]
MSYPSDLTDDQWGLLEPVFNAPGKRGRKHADDLPTVVDAMLYIAQTGCQLRYLPESFGPWTRVWSQFRRWTRNGTWARALTVLHEAARAAEGRADATPSMVVVIDPTPPEERLTAASPSTTAAAPTAATRARSASLRSTCPASRWVLGSCRPPPTTTGPASSCWCTSLDAKPARSFRPQGENAGLGPTRTIVAACVLGGSTLEPPEDRRRVHA